MNSPESSVGIVSPLSWRTYSVSRSDKEPLLRFVVEALEVRGCRVISESPANRAPFYVVFETPVGQRVGVLVYAFFANTQPTRNRPPDEHRFQIKYGSELGGILE